MKPITDCDLTDSERFGALINRWDALDTETGAYLSGSNGRTKYGDRRYVLIFPRQSPAERGGLFEPYDWTEKDRKFIRAWSLAEAIEIAEKRLAKMRAERAAERRQP